MFCCTNVPACGNSTSYHALPFGKQSPLGWTFFSENTYSALPAGSKGLCGIQYLYNLLPELRELFPEIVRIPSIYYIPLQLLQLKPAFLLPVLELAGPQREAAKIAGLISETTNITAEIVAEQPFFKVELPQITCYLNVISVVHNLRECAVLLSLISLRLLTITLMIHVKSNKFRLLNRTKMALPFIGSLILFLLIIIIGPCAGQCVSNLITC